MNMKRVGLLLVFFLLGWSGMFDRSGFWFAREIPSPPESSSHDSGIPNYAYGDPSGYSPKSAKGLGAYGGSIDDAAASWMGRKIVEAVSLDGLNWVVLGYVDPDPDTPAIHVPQAFVLREGQTTWMYILRLPARRKALRLSLRSNPLHAPQDYSGRGAVL